MFRMPHKRAGDPILADDFNEIAAQLEKFLNLTVAQGSGLVLQSGDWGHAMALALPVDLWVQLSGSSSPYSWVEVVANAGGTWSAYGQRSGTNNAYAINNTPNLNGKVVRLSRTGAGDWRFEYLGHMSTCAPDTAQICATILDDGCGTPLGTGATITVKDHTGSVVGTCTTTGTVTALSLVSGGTGYTNGTGYALAFSGGGGSGAAGTFDVVGGVVGNLQLTAGGSGYTSAPSVSFAAAGGGSGAGATATTQERCCIPISSSGTYTVTSDVPGTTTKTTTISATCTLGNNVNFTYASNTLGTLCLSTSTDCSPVGGTLTFTGTGSGSVSSGTGGQKCIKLGVGSYSGTVTLSSGFSTPVSFSVAACSTANVTVGTVTQQAGTYKCDQRLFDGACGGCTGTVTIKDGGGTVLGTATTSAVTHDPAPSTCCSCTYSMTITETLVGTAISATAVFPSVTLSDAGVLGCDGPGGSVCSGGTTSNYFCF